MENKEEEVEEEIEKEERTAQLDEQVLETQSIESNVKGVKE